MKSAAESRAFGAYRAPAYDAGWPNPLGPSAMQGLAGEFVDIVGPHSEADPAALLFQFLVGFGNVAGRGPHFVAEADHHGTNLFTILVGQTSKGRKGFRASAAFPNGGVGPVGTWVRGRSDSLKSPRLSKT